MGIAKGIKAIQEATAPRESTTTDYVKARWLKLADGEDVTIRFINELDADSPNYDIGRGLAVVVDEHQAPGKEGFKRHALCSKDDEGKCWCCDRVNTLYSAGDKEGAKPWRSKKKLYINVLVDNGKDAPYTALWSMGTYRNDKYTMIFDTFIEKNSISNITWRLKRTGTGKDDTTYTFYPKGEDTKPFKWPADLEVYDIEKDILRHVPYDEQAQFYGFGNEVAADELKGSTNVDW